MSKKYGDNTITNNEIINETNYYPFGLSHEGYNVDVATSYKYKYNGKELQDEDGLNLTAMDFRNYDNALGRFNVIDPLAEMDYSSTPYHFTNNNPVLFSDPSGLKGIQTNYGIDGFGRNQFDGMGMYITPDARGASRTPNMFNIMDGGDGYGGSANTSAIYYLGGGSGGSGGGGYYKIYHDYSLTRDGAGYDGPSKTYGCDTVNMGYWDKVMMTTGDFLFLKTLANFGNNDGYLDVDASTLDFSFVKQSNLKHTGGNNYSVDLFKLSKFNNNSLALGKLSLVKVSRNQYTINNDIYDFNIEWNNIYTMRNFGTAVDAAIHYSSSPWGQSYVIRFHGTVTIKP